MVPYAAEVIARGSKLSSSSERLGKSALYVVDRTLHI